MSESFIATCFVILPVLWLCIKIVDYFLGHLWPFIRTMQIVHAITFIVASLYQKSLIHTYPSFQNKIDSWYCLTYVKMAEVLFLFRKNPTSIFLDSVQLVHTIVKPWIICKPSRFGTHVKVNIIPLYVCFHESQLFTSPGLRSYI